MEEKKSLLVALLVITSLSILCLSCGPTTVGDLVRKKEAGDSIAEVYDYNWKEVYDAMKFVWRHSENWDIQLLYQRGKLDFAEDEKAIFIGSVETTFMGIFFEPQVESRTKAIFVGGGYPSSQPGKTITNLLIEETHYYLDNGKDAYLEYTHREYEEQLRKTRADQ